MAKLARLYARNPAIRELALSWTRGLPGRDYRAEAAVIWREVRNRVRFVQDIEGLETVQTPLATLQNGAGDCDDQSTLVAALLSSIGHRLSFKAVDVGKGGLSHVYVIDHIPGVGAFPLDAAEPNYPPGTEVSPVVRSMMQEV